jgi:hypothetical protein
LASHERTVSQVPPNEELYAVSNHPEDSDNDVTSLIVNEDVPKSHVNSEVQTEALGQRGISTSGIDLSPSQDITEAASGICVPVFAATESEADVARMCLLVAALFIVAVFVW